MIDQDRSHRQVDVALSARRLCYGAAFLAASAGAMAATPGTYAIRTQTSEPNNRENLRYSDHTVRRTLPADVTAAYFPMLDLPLFSACKLTSPQVLNASVMYFLVCPGSSGTTGSAIVQDRGQHIEGVLSVRMGGKNMTFTQRIDARLNDTSQ